MDDVTIEDLAFEVRHSREVDEVSRPRCLSTRQEKDSSHVMKKRAQAKAKCGENREQG
jgi:hypothetical protein